MTSPRPSTLPASAKRGSCQNNDHPTPRGKAAISRPFRPARFCYQSSLSYPPFTRFFMPVLALHLTTSHYIHTKCFRPPLFFILRRPNFGFCLRFHVSTLPAPPSVRYPYSRYSSLSSDKISISCPHPAQSRHHALSFHSLQLTPATQNFKKLKDQAIQYLIA